jgi:hypothetical protein
MHTCRRESFSRTRFDEARQESWESQHSFFIWRDLEEWDLIEDWIAACFCFYFCFCFGLTITAEFGFSCWSGFLGWLFLLHEHLAFERELGKLFHFLRLKSGFYLLFVCLI